MKERLRFRCPCCGMIADVDRLNGEGPYELELFIQRFGGKVKLTDDEKEDRRDGPFRRGSARGFIEYEKVEDGRFEELKTQIEKRIKETGTRS